MQLEYVAYLRYKTLLVIVFCISTQWPTPDQWQQWRDYLNVGRSLAVELPKDVVEVRMIYSFNFLIEGFHHVYDSL